MRDSSHYGVADPGAGQGAQEVGDPRETRPLLRRDTVDYVPQGVQAEAAADGAATRCGRCGSSFRTLDG
jgi:hypothetical protein